MWPPLASCIQAASKSPKACFLATSLIRTLSLVSRVADLVYTDLFSTARKNYSYYALIHAPIYVIV